MISQYMFCCRLLVVQFIDKNCYREFLITLYPVTHWVFTWKNVFTICKMLLMPLNPTLALFSKFETYTHCCYLSGLWHSTHASDTTSWNFACYIRYIYCIYNMPLVLMHSCADIWSTQNKQSTIFLGISLIFHISVKHWLCIHIDLLTLTCIIINNHVKKYTPFLLFRYIQPSKY